MRETMEYISKDGRNCGQLMKIATMVCCPLCDEPKCVGRFKCAEIKAYIESRGEVVISKMETVEVIAFCNEKD